MSALIPTLTKLNQQTVFRLKNNDYSNLTQASVTNVLKKIIKDKNSSTELIPKVIEYEKIKNPSKDIVWIEKYITSKLPLQDKKVFREILKDGDYSSFPSIDKPKPKPKAKISEPISDFSSFKDNKTKDKESNGINQVLEKLLNTDKETKDKETKDKKTKKTKEDKPSEVNWDTILQGSSKYLSDNKKTIDTLKKALTKESIDNGSWLTQISSLSVPEIAVVQELLKNTPLGMSKQDNINLDNILSGKQVDGGVNTILKSLINPDAIGKIISTQGSKAVSKAGDGLIDFYNKLTTGKSAEKAKSEETLNTEQKIIQRREDLSKAKKRKEDLEKLGIKSSYEDAINSGYSNMSAADLAKRPELNLQTTNAFEDFMSGLQNLFIPTGGRSERLDTVPKMRKYLEMNDPQKLKEFDEQASKFDRRLSKINLSRTSEVNPSMDQEVLKNIVDYNNRLINKASSTKQLTNQQIEDIYDINSSLEDILTGKGKITYDQLDKTIQSIMTAIPTSLLKDESLNTDAYRTDLKYKLSAGFAGDSDLIDVDKYIENRMKETTDDDKQIDDKPKPIDDKPIDDKPKPTDDKINNIKETTLDSKSKTTGPTDYSTLKPRFVAGATDEKFTRDADEVALADLLSEMKNIDIPAYGRDHGNSNTLYQRNIDDYEIRYRNTFKTPQSEPVYQPKNTKEYNDYYRSIWTPIYQPVGYHPTHDPNNYGAFQEFNNKDFETVQPVNLRIQQRQDFPDTTNMLYPNDVIYATNKHLDFIFNQRFTKRFK